MSVSCTSSARYGSGTCSPGTRSISGSARPARAYNSSSGYRNGFAVGMRVCSGITIRSMLRQKEFVKQPVHLQQAFAIQFYLVAFDAQEAPVLQPLHRLGKLRCGIDSEL